MKKFRIWLITLIAGNIPIGINLEIYGFDKRTFLKNGYYIKCKFITKDYDRYENKD